MVQEGRASISFLKPNLLNTEACPEQTSIQENNSTIHLSSLKCAQKNKRIKKLETI